MATIPRHRSVADGGIVPNRGPRAAFGRHQIPHRRKKRKQAKEKRRFSGGTAAPRPAARSAASDHPSGREVTSVHGRRDFQPPTGGRSRLFMNDAGRRRRTSGEAFRSWPVCSHSGHEPLLDPRRERALRRRPSPGWNRASRVAPEPPLLLSSPPRRSRDSVMNERRSGRGLPGYAASDGRRIAARWASSFGVPPSGGLSVWSLRLESRLQPVFFHRQAILRTPRNRGTPDATRRHCSERIPAAHSPGEAEIFGPEKVRLLLTGIPRWMPPDPASRAGVLFS
jgi:hypothetical protein